jgi:carbonic anhydrase/acetyltransferase-like protein (isoleucine patch superfamily)
MIDRYLAHEPVIDPTAWVHPTAVVIGEVRLGARVGVWPTCVLRGDQGAIHVGDETNVQDGTICHATGGVSRTTVGTRCTIGHRVVLHGCTVGDDCLVGMGSILLDNAEIGPECVIGAGALVPVGARIPPRSLVLGMPGRVVRAVTERDLERIRLGHQTYLRLLEEHRGGR